MGDGRDEPAGGGGDVVERLATARDRIGVACACLAALVGGVVLWIGPEELRREIPRHREIGAGFVVFGVVATFAFLLRGTAGYRARSLLLAMIAAVVGGFVGWSLVGKARDVLDLHRTGEIRPAKVVGPDLRFDPRTRKVRFRTEVSIDGRRAKVELDFRARRGEVVEVLVVPDRPTVVVGGGLGRDLLSLVDAVIGRWIGLIFALLTLFCLVALPIKLRDALLGPPAGVDPDADRP